MTNTAEHLAQAQEITAMIDRKVRDLLDPLEREMRRMGYKPEFREIMWHAVIGDAVRRHSECRKG
ncbi:hypothetical protein [Niveispirillum sp.]|uniref:hypothetical protein n=1 Tax=Niveispirillum sp. TaxID=1917217 RepID=UPI001B7167F5|nr:hypothetical protein [Niveispirillum sp.]MBP7337675.1 hypothetical protein [Niveispirillum sp.]